MPKTIGLKENLREFLLSSDETISLEEARRRLDQKWSKLK